MTLWAIGEILDGRMTPDEVIPFGQNHGYDLKGAAAWLEGRGNGAAMSGGSPVIWTLFDKRTLSAQYVVSDLATSTCAIIEPVLDFDEKSGAIATMNADALLAHVAEQGLRVAWILDTHPHADHFSAAEYLKGKTNAPTAIGAKVTEVQKLWKDIYNFPDLRTDGSQWDRLLDEGETFRIGGLDVRVMLSPGHTLASMALVQTLSA